MKTVSLRIGFCLLSILLGWAIAGCSSDDAFKVNKAAMACHTSLTDDISRMLATNTLGRAKEKEEDYKLGPDDELTVTVFEWLVRQATKTVDVRISESGRITLPLIGSIETKGRTVEQVEKEVSSRLIQGGYIKTPRVTVRIKEFRSKIISVMGAVNQPGQHTIRQNVTTLLDALSLAGGMNEFAGYEILVLRPSSAETMGASIISDELSRISKSSMMDNLPQELKALDKKIITIDTNELIDKGNLALNMILSNGDIVFVPEARQFFVVGFVRKPGGYPLKKPTTVLEAIAHAEGLMENEASPHYCFLKRREKDGEVLLPIDLVSISDGIKPNIYLRPDDILDVRQTFWKKLENGTLDLVKNVFSVGYSVNSKYLR